MVVADIVSRKFPFGLRFEAIEKRLVGNDVDRENGYKQFGRIDFWDRLGGKVLVMIGRWYSKQPITNQKEHWSIQTMPPIFAPKACPNSFWIGDY